MFTEAAAAAAVSVLIAAPLWLSPRVHVVVVLPRRQLTLFGSASSPRHLFLLLSSAFGVPPLFDSGAAL